MRTLKRSKAVVALTAGLLLAGGGIAYADNVVNDVTAGGSDTITAGGSTTVSYKVNANGGDGQNGCNASDGSPVTVNLSVPLGVTASATSLTFSACNAFQDVTFSSNTAGNYAINVSSISDSGAGAYSNQANFTLKVNAAPVTNTAPTLNLPQNQTVEATGPNGAVVNYNATASDAEDGALTPNCSPGSGSTFSLGTTTVNCSASDGSLSTSGSFTVTVVDTTGPALTLPSNITEEATGPSGAIVSYTAATASDLVDGAVTASCAPTSGSTFVLGTTTVNCSATDAANNTSNGSFTVTVRDTTAPVITWVGGPADGSSHYFGSVPAVPTCTASDLVSGSVSCSVTGYSGAVGEQTLTATATDGALNTATDTRDYTVLAWNLSGFYAPVDMGGVWNTVKGGSTVPLKFEVFAGAAELTSTSASEPSSRRGRSPARTAR